MTSGTGTAEKNKKSSQKSSSHFERVPTVGICMGGFSLEEKGELEEVIEGLEQLKIPYRVVEEFFAEALSECDTVVVAPSVTKRALKAGIVPVAQMGEGLQDYKAVQETGNGFFYETQNHWEIFAAVVKMLENYQFPYDWANLKRIVEKS